MSHDPAARESHVYRAPAPESFYEALRALLGQRVCVLTSGGIEWTGQLVQVALDFIRVEDPTDPYTIFQSRTIERVSVVPETKGKSR